MIELNYMGFKDVLFQAGNPGIFVNILYFRPFEIDNHQLTNNFETI
jgi:hypothetical protein